MVVQVEFTSEAEKKRFLAKNQSWAILETTNIVEALHKAKELGWKDKKVQVRYEKFDDYEMYYVEPYEKGCGCKGILKYKEYFD